MYSEKKEARTIINRQIFDPVEFEKAQMVNALNEDRVLEALARNDVIFSRRDSHLIQMCKMLCSSLILVRV